MVGPACNSEAQSLSEGIFCLLTSTSLEVISFSLLVDPLLISPFQVSLLPILQSASIAFLVLAQSFPFLPCDHSMPVDTVIRAYSQYASLLLPLSEMSTRHSIPVRICQRTASPSTYSDLLALTEIPLYRSWSGFMEAGSIVRRECLYIPLNLMSKGGASSGYDGAPVVERSVARVCTSSHPD